MPRQGDPITPRLETIEDAEAAWDSVLNRAGALPHDATSARMIRETRKGTGNQRYDADIEADRSALKKFEIPAPEDTDGDGLPDAWEEKRGLNVNDASDSALKTDSGYTHLEHYCHELAASLIQAAKKGEPSNQ